MKKALAMALGAMLCVGTAAPASAASQIDFSGYYRTYFINNWNESFTDKETRTNDSYFANRLVLNFAFQATDEVSAYFQLRAPSAQRWGGNPNNPGAEAGSNNATMYHAYGQVKQDWGTVSIGRLNDEYMYLGLASVGYNPGGVATDTSWGVFDLPNDPYDGIRYENRWDGGFQLVAQFFRMDQQRYLPNGDTESHDLYMLQPSFHWDTGAASLAVIYEEDQTRQDLLGGVQSASLKNFFINPAFAQSFGDFTVHFEGMYATGKDYAALPGTENKAGGSGVYLDFDYNYGPGNVMLAGWWLEGSKADGKDKSMVSSGEGSVIGADFVPFLVAYGEIRAGDRGNAIALANSRSALNKGFDGDSGNNHWALALAGSHAFTDAVTMNYVVGHMALNRVEAGAKKDIGWEADLGFDIKLLDNLSLNTAFGYLSAGKALDDRTDPDNIIKGKDGYTWYNTLTFSF